MNHDFVYFYKDDSGENIPIMTGGYYELDRVMWPDEDTKKAIQDLMPSKNDLYVLVDNHVFKLGKDNLWEKKFMM